MNTTSNRPEINRNAEVGNGCSWGAGSDSYPGTIVEVAPNGKTLWVTSDETFHFSGDDMHGNSTYTTLPNPDGARTEYTLRKNGTWLPKGTPLKYYWAALTIGVRRDYRDPSF